MKSNVNKENINFLVYLQNLIDKRKVELPEKSYTTKLFKNGLNKIAQKVGEEAIELIIESGENNDNLFLNEAADLIYHFMVLLSIRKLRIEDVIEILKQRHYK